MASRLTPSALSLKTLARPRPFNRPVRKRPVVIKAFDQSDKLATYDREFYITRATSTLLTAVQEKISNVAKRIVENTDSITVTDEMGRNILMIAIMTEQTELAMEILKSRKISLKDIDLEGKSSLVYAIEVGNEPMALALIRNGADIGYIFKVKDSIKTPLLTAIRFKQDRIALKVIEILLDINSFEKYGVSPLTAAIQNSQTAIVKSLLEKGANPNFVNSDKRSPLQVAFMVENEDIVSLLLKHKVNVDQVFEIGPMKFTPLMLAIDLRMTSSALEIIERTNEVNKAEEWHKSPLVMAIDKKLDLVVKYLLNKGANVNFEDSSKYGPLFAALKSKQEFLACQLIDKMDISFLESRKSMLLNLARMKDLKAVQYKLEHLSK